MLVLDYPTKKSLKESVGQTLRYTETSIFGEEFMADGVIFGSNRPHLTGHKREFFAKVTMRGGKIADVD